MGQNVYAHAQLTPSFLMPHFGISRMFDDQVALRMQNQALPQIDLGYQFTNGVQMAYGFSLPRTARSQNEWRFGIGGKLMWRRGGYRLLSIEQLMNLSKNTLFDLAGSYAPGFGVDVGTQFIHTFNRALSLQFGAAMTDIGDTNFGSYADPQKSNAKFGVALKSDMKALRVVLSYDYQHAFDNVDWRLKQHLGFEFALPLLSIYGGLDELYPTYGFGVDVWLVKITALSYAEELSSVYGQDPERRYMLRVSVKLGM